MLANKAEVKRNDYEWGKAILHDRPITMLPRHWEKISYTDQQTYADWYADLMELIDSKRKNIKIHVFPSLEGNYVYMYVNSYKGWTIRQLDPNDTVIFEKLFTEPNESNGDMAIITTDELRAKMEEPEKDDEFDYEED